MTGLNWYQDSNTVLDPEYKVTEFDYENYFDTKLIPKGVPEQEFKRLIKVLNLFSQTEHERL